MSRLRTWHQRNRTKHTERSLKHLLSNIQRVTSALDMPRIVTDTTCEHGIKGHSVEVHAAALVLLAVKQLQLPFRAVEITKVSHVRDVKSVTRQYRRLKNRLDVNTIPLEPQDHVPKQMSLLRDADTDTSIDADAVRRTTAQHPGRHLGRTVHRGEEPACNLCISRVHRVPAHREQRGLNAQKAQTE